MKQTIYLTQRKQYTEMEVIDDFSDSVSVDNLEILVKHLTMDISNVVESFTEQDGVLFLGIDGEFLSIQKKTLIITCTPQNYCVYLWGD